MSQRTDPPAFARLRAHGMLAVAAPLLLAGILPLPPDLSSKWGWSGAWVYPVGDPHVAPLPLEEAGTDYRVVRGVTGSSGPDRGHDGVDLSCGAGGGEVRAAGNGLVVHAAATGWNRGYGRHVVLAHQLAEGGLAYSVYAHLAPGSVSVRRGDRVAAGRVIGRVGMTGRASSPHLHFEVRLAGDPFERWQSALPEDPVAFIAARLPTPHPSATWSRPYLEWAECAALIPLGVDGERRPTRAEWWRALLRSTRHPLAAIPSSAESLRAALVEMRLLEEDRRADPEAPLGWGDLARVVPRARDLGLRLPWSPVAREGRRAHCRRELGTATPSDNPEGLSGDPWPDRAAMCLLLADLAGDPPPPRSKPKSKPKPKPATNPAPRPATP